MRHHNTNKKFGRETGQRKALMRSLARSLFLKGSVTTTEARAKAMRGFVERLITRAKNPTLANRRLLISRLGGDESIVKKVEGVAAGMKDRSGGYVRVVKLQTRISDGSSRAFIAFVNDEK